MTELVGYMRESHIWQMLFDISRTVTEDGKTGLVAPESIIWENGHFGLISTTDNVIDEKDLVWQLAATTFHLFMGCPVFNGGGQQAQHEGSPLPYMRKSMPELSNLVCQMLTYNVASRPTMKEIQKAAESNLSRLQATHSMRPVKKRNANKNNIPNTFWPDEF